MPSSDDTPRSRRRWLDWWFAPRWRALVTWVALTVLMGWAGYLGVWTIRDKMVDFIFGHLGRAMSTPLPMRDFALRSNGLMLIFWFEPFALRLNLLRGLAWLVLRIGPYLIEASILWTKIPPLLRNHHYEVLVPIAIMASSLLMVPLLRGSRSRPWMALIGGALVAGVQYYLAIAKFPIGDGLWVLAMTLPYAAVLIYGTRLLMPEEREQCHR
jgi:hypothetical protein